MRRSTLTVGGILALSIFLAGCTVTPQPFPELTYAEQPCYRTLADVDCHPHVLVGEESRRVGFYDEPVSVEQKKTWYQKLF